MEARIIVNPEGQAPVAPQERGNSMPFRSILFDHSESGVDVDKLEAPEFFSDLNLDHVVASITAGRDEYNLKPFFYTPLRHVEAITYRYDILRDLESEALFGYIRSFAREMQTMRGHLAQAGKLYNTRQKQSWFLDAVEIYCGAVRGLRSDLAITGLHSRGFQAFHEYLTSYADSNDFVSLATETQLLKSGLSTINYSLHIHGKRITVGKYDSEDDYGVDVLQTFDKFRQGAPKEYRFDFHSGLDMNDVEAAVLDLVAQVFPETFLALDEYRRRHSDFLNMTIATFEREVQFYVAWIEYSAPLKRAGLAFAYPTVTDQSKEVYGCEVFDIDLADKLV